MSSPAIKGWRSSRLPRLDRMLAAHPESAGSSTDPTLAQEWTEALVLRLAAEFQGFCRDLHDDVVEVIMGSVVVPSVKIRSRLMNGLLLGRGLDRRSADPGTIGDDFGRLGPDLWAHFAIDRPGRVAGWREGLMMLHRARNGLVHDDRGAVAEAQSAGWPIQVGAVRAWRNLLDEIAASMESGVTREISELIGRVPWESEN